MAWVHHSWTAMKRHSSKGTYINYLSTNDAAAVKASYGQNFARLAVLKRKYPLILVSNTNEAHAEFIRAKYRIFDYFDHHVLSYRVGSLKPDMKIFEHAILASGCPPETLFFTDDREENVRAAQQLGIHSHRFVSESKLIDALRQAGVEIGGNGNVCSRSSSRVIRG